MVQLRHPGLLLAVSLWLSPAVRADDSATCTRTVVARAGDTCATLSASNALSVTQFINLNPTLNSCTLTPGATYCVSTDPAATTSRTTGLPPPTSTSAPAAGPTGSLVPSPDGSDGICGGQYTCLGSVYGDCCSAVGYCGNTTDYCGEGCNAVFGRCGGGEQPGAGATVTVTVSGTCPAGATRTVTSIVTVSVPVSVTQTKTVTATTSAPAKPSPTLEGTPRNCKTFYQLKPTDTCSRLARSLGISLDQLYTWNPELDCDDPPRGYYICVGV